MAASGHSTAGASHRSKPSFTFVSFFEDQKDRPLFTERGAPEYPAANKSDKKRDSFDAPRPYDSAWNRVPAWLPIVVWIAFSSAVILFNKYILSDLNFPFPIFLVTCHLAFQTLFTRIAYRSTNLVNGAKELLASGRMNRQVFMRNVLPIGILFSLSLVTSNWVYLRLSVSFIQMIKALTPVSVLLLSFAFRLKEPSQKLFYIVCLISGGIALASYGEIGFDMAGFLVQLLAILLESSRLVMIQILLQGVGMDPLTSLFFYAPVCLTFNLALLIPGEGLEPLYLLQERVGLPLLLANCCVTLGLNLSSVWIIGKASGLVLTLAGVIKDILLIGGSWAVMGSSITGIQILGYAVALTGLVMYKTMA